MTYYWQESRGYPEWRIQTDSGEVAERLRKRSKYEQIGRGHDKGGSIWLFRVGFERVDNARKVLGKIDSKGTLEVK